MTTAKAKTIIADLVEAAQDSTLASLQDGGAVEALRKLEET